jgi:hypothetical protein
MTTIPQSGTHADASIPAAITSCADRDHLTAEVLDIFVRIGGQRNVGRRPVSLRGESQINR